MARLAMLSVLLAIAASSLLTTPTSLNGDSLTRPPFTFDAVLWRNRKPVYDGRATRAVGPAIPAIRPIKSRKVTFNVTFNHDVAPILFQNCAPCHRPGEVAPFSLLTYADAAKRATQIASVTASRWMPPWKPAPGHGHFRNEKVLTAAEIGTIQTWARNGAPEGDPADLPVAPQFTEGWHAGPPDFIAEMPAAFHVGSEGEDVYQCFVLPTHLTSDRYLKSLEFRPGNRRIVHHALLFTHQSTHMTTNVSTGTSTAASEIAQTDSSYPCFGAPGFLPSTALGGWSPGNSAITYPDGTAGLLKKGADIVLQIHYHRTGKPEDDRSQVGFYFTDRPPMRKLMDIPLGSRLIDIPPGDPAYKVTDRFSIPIAVEAVGIIPHAHYICKQMHGWATLPNGKKIELMLIKDWDFNWQEQYWFSKPIRLPKDTSVEMEFVYDNSTNNPRNPNSPPARVTWGPRTTDEMAGLHLQVIAEKPEDIPELNQALWGKLMRSVGGRFYSLPGQSLPEKTLPEKP
jgi:hypothetical protein